MDEAKKFEILKRLLNRDSISELAEIVVVHDVDGYVMFNDFKISQTDKNFEVSRFSTHCRHNFYTLKNAVIWCTLTKRNLIYQANNILSLDKMLEGAVANSVLHEHLSKKTKNSINKSLYFAKLEEDKSKKSYILREIENYAKEVKKWQYRQFAALK